MAGNAVGWCLEGMGSCWGGMGVRGYVVRVLGSFCDEENRGFCSIDWSKIRASIVGFAFRPSIQGSRSARSMP